MNVPRRRFSGRTRSDWKGQTRSIYQDGTYAEKNPTWDEEDSSWKSRHILRVIETHGLSPKTVCEVGCGAGEILNQLHRLLPDPIDFIGYEISPQVFPTCKKKEKARLKFVLGNFLDMNKRHYDLLLVIDVLEHVEDCYGFLRRLQSHGTYKIFHIPLDIAAWKVLGGYLMTKREQYGHIHYFTRETALAMLKDAGYEIVDSFYTGLYFGSHRRSMGTRLMDSIRKGVYTLHPDLSARLFGGLSLMVLAR
jgi:SAM-dependent methyltransferase